MNKWTVVASGAAGKRASLLTHLDRSGLADASQQPAVNPSHGLPLGPKTDSWVTFLTDDIEGPREIIHAHGWRQRLHWLTPPCSVCEGTGQNTSGQPCPVCNGEGLRNEPSPYLNPVDRLDAKGVI